MHQCAIDESEAILHLLIKYGANINATDRDQWTPLHAAGTTIANVSVCLSFMTR